MSLTAVKFRKMLQKLVTRLYGCVRSVCRGIWKTKYDWLAIATVTFIISTVWSPRFPDPKNLYGNNSDDDFISIDYLQSIRGAMEEPVESGYISIVDIGDVTSRRRIAEVLDSIYNLDPRCIGVDLDFSAEQEPFTDSILSATISRIKDKTVFVNQLYGYDDTIGVFTRLHRSYFSDGRSGYLSASNLKEGFANLKNNGTSEMVSRYSMAERLNDSICLSLPARMVDDPDVVDMHDHYISYYPTVFNIVNHDEVTEEDIAGSFVLVGAIGHSGDKYNTPLGLMPGVMIHAYILQTIVEGSEVMEMSAWLDVIMTFLTVVVFVMILVGLDYFINHTRHHTASLIVQTGFLTFGLTYLTALALGLLSYDLFTEHNVYASMHGVINSLLIVASIVKVVYSTAIIIASRYGVCRKLVFHSSYSSYP